MKKIEGKYILLESLKKQKVISIHVIKLHKALVSGYLQAVITGKLY